MDISLVCHKKKIKFLSISSKKKIELINHTRAKH